MTPLPTGVTASIGDDRAEYTDEWLRVDGAEQCTLLSSVGDAGIGASV
jgi:hypothetical protein